MDPEPTDRDHDSEQQVEDAAAIQEAEDPRPPPRLMITKMVLEDFKSYAGVKEIGPFHKCFSAVVGPNGSGKSNVIDAMLFVFGKRAKKLRLNKVSELIHKSDAVRDNPPDCAKVSVYFHEIIDTGDGDDDYEVVPNTQTVVSRVAHKNNSSTYKLNGKNSSFKDIALYLSSKGIDLDNNRFLILQGEVEMISMMSPKGKNESDEGLLEYLEDIIGSSKFVDETNQAEEEVDALSEVRQEKLNRVKAVEKEKDNLEGAKQEAEALVEKEREIRRKQNTLYQVYSMRADLDEKKYEGRRTGVQEHLDKENEQLKLADERLKELEDGLSEQRKDYDAIAKELKKTKDEFSAFERQDIKLREEIKHGRGQVKKLDEKIKSESKKYKAAVAKRDKATLRIPVLEEETIALTETKAEEDAKLEKIYDDMKGVTEQLRHELEAKVQELAPVKQERSVFQAALDNAQEEIRLLEDSRTRIEQRLALAEEELSKLDETKSAKQQSLAETKAELDSAKERVVEAETEEAELAKREEGLNKHSRQLLAQVEDAKASIQSTGGGTRSRAVAGILKASRKGGELSQVGVLGRLGDLAAIHEKYDVAVSTACGMLDHIVVQTTAGAQRCLEFLRKHNLGRVSFVPLDKQKKGAHDRAVETPENAPRLFELITPANYAITPAIYLAVGNTLVAPDLETASRWGFEYKRRWRVVTLDGQLIETAGTMAGGGKNVRRGGMRLANSRRAAAAVQSEEDATAEVDRLEKEAAQARELLQQCRHRRRELSDEIRALNKTIKALEVKIPKLHLEVSGCETTRADLTKLIPELRAQCQTTEEDAAKRDELAEKVDKCKSDMVTCAALAEKLEAEVAHKQKLIMEAGGSKLRNQKKACEVALKRLNENESSLNSSRVDVRSSEKAIVKAENGKADFEEQLEECQQTLAEKELEFKSLEAGAMEVMQAYESVKLVEAGKRESFEEASKESDELKKQQSSLKCKQIELLGQIESFDKQVSDSRKKKNHWEKEIKRLCSIEEEFCDEEESDESDSDSEQGETNVEDQQMPSEEANSGDEMDVDSESKPEAETVEDDGSVLPRFQYVVLEKYDPENIKETIAVLESERSTLAKHANMGAIAEYRKKEKDYLSKIGELDEVSDARNAARRKHEDLRRQRLEMFMDGFGQITLKLKEMYQMITLGGDAELELVDSLDPFSEGIVFSVRPPKKSWKNISNLSGGEKTLSSLALVFALHHYKPTPLYVMDEIDAALDFKNVSIVGNYIKERTKNAQFIIISLRNNMFELADRLVGIYKTNNCTKSVTINPHAFGLEGQQARQKSGTTPHPLSDRTNVRSNKKQGKSAIDDEPTASSSMVVV